MPTGGGGVTYSIVEGDLSQTGASDVQDNTANELNTRANFDVVIHIGLAWAVVEIESKETQSATGGQPKRLTGHCE